MTDKTEAGYMDPRIVALATHFDAEYTLRLAAEECAELATACLHVIRAEHDGDRKEGAEKTMAAFIEEVADVQIMLDRLRVQKPKLFEAAEKYRESKIDRTIKRYKLEQAVDPSAEYDPLKWSPWPKVQPPAEGFYRVQVDSIYKEHETRFVWQWKNGRWYHADGKSWVSVSVVWSNIRFKAWED